MEWQTDIDNRPKFAAYLGVNDESGRTAAYEVGVWRTEQAAFAYVRRVLGKPASEAFAGLPEGISADDFDPIHGETDYIIHGATIERFTDESGTNYVWDFEFMGGEIVLTDAYSY